MWISGTTQYALRAVLHVAQHGALEPVRVDEIAAALDVPRNYLSKTLHALARAGVLRSGRGPRGGFQLAESPATLTLGRVAAPFDDLAQRHCLLRQQACGVHTCPAHGRWEAISASLTAFFSETTIDDLLRGRSAGIEPPAQTRAAPVARRSPAKAAGRTKGRQNVATGVAGRRARPKRK